jgi:hypothetical protein
VGSLVLACVTTACASGSRSDGSVRCEGCTIEAAVVAVAAAVAENDAQLAESRVDETAGHGELWALIDWRRPEADSAVLIVRLAADAAGATVSYSAVPLARVLEMSAAATPVPNAPGPPIEVCQPCRSWQVAIEAAPGDNLRALASQCVAAQRFGAALASRFTAPPGTALPRP